MEINVRDLVAKIRACEGLGNFTNKYINYLPFFESNVFCKICEELAFNIVRAVF